MQRKLSYYAIVALALVLAAAIPSDGRERKVSVRPSALAGSWYPADAGQLGAMIDKLLREAKPYAGPGGIRGLILPHAGYSYSGRCAAAGYASVAKESIRRVIILGTPHCSRFAGGSIPDVDAYETPLGQVPLDREACDKLLADRLFITDPYAHGREHSIEIQLPFLQKIYKDFTMVPIIVGDVPDALWQQFGDALAELMDDDTLLVVSTDFTHYGNRFGYVPFDKDIPENIKKLDQGAFAQIEAGNRAGFLNYKRETRDTICGANAVAAALEAFKGRAKPTLVEYYTSADILGDYSHCISYATFAFVEDPGAKRSEGASTSGRDADAPALLTGEEKAELLKIARTTLDRLVRDKKLTDAVSGEFKLTDTLREKRGAFVTLKKRGQLRGCIGYIEGRKPLAETVAENTVNAASRDYRFPHPVRPEEMDDIKIEISALTPLRRAGSPDDVEVGRHGIYIVKGDRRGLLLPQVATEQGWSKEQFLQGVCRKAGLPPAAYKEPGTVLYLFEAEVFGEEDAD